MSRRFRKRRSQEQPLLLSICELSACRGPDMPYREWPKRTPAPSTNAHDERHLLGLNPWFRNCNQQQEIGNGGPPNGLPTTLFLIARFARLFRFRKFSVANTLFSPLPILGAGRPKPNSFSFNWCRISRLGKEFEVAIICSSLGSFQFRNDRQKYSTVFTKAPNLLNFYKH